MTRFSSLAAAVFACLCLAIGAGVPQLVGGDSLKDWKQPTWKVPPEQYNEIAKMDAAAGTLTIEHHGGKQKVVRDVTVNTFTEIRIADQKTTLASFKPGMHVDYTLGGDGTTLARLEKVEPIAPPPTPVPTATPSFPNATPKPGKP